MIEVQFARRVKSLSLILILTVAGYGSSAWNKPGHMVTAAIAYAELREHDPVAARAVARIISSIESREFRRAVAITSQTNPRELALFAYAARWPDDVRGSDEDREPWHYINYPFKVPGSSATTENPPASNIEQALRENLEILAAPAQTKLNRARAMCWLFHLVGDSHQPLHSAKLFSDEFPNGDRGGTRFYVKEYDGSKKASGLHGIWDGAVIKGEDLSRVRDRAATLRAKYPKNSFAERNTSDYKQWIQESFQLAKSVSYRDGSLVGSSNENNGTPLSSEYRRDMRNYAEQRATLAGYRLAAYLSLKY